MIFPLFQSQSVIIQRKLKFLLYNFLPIIIRRISIYIMKDGGIAAFITYEPVYHRYIIFVNAEDSEPLRRWCISLAIGYIENHKIKANCGIPITSADKFINDFAYVYTCPDCILKRDGILSSEKIIEVCKIPFQKAHEKSKRLALLSKQKIPRNYILKKLFVIFLKKSRFPIDICLSIKPSVSRSFCFSDSSF